MKIRQLTQTALMIAAIIVLGMIPPIPLGIIPVPIVMQNLGIMLAGLFLGSKNGTIAVGVFLLLAFLGFPVLSGGQAGPAVFIGPTAGYLFGWLITPLMMGYRRSRPFMSHSWGQLIVIWISGVLIVNLMGALWLWWVTPISLIGALTSGLLFIPGDTLKAVVAYLVAVRMKVLSRAARQV
ncbi:biotin transporter BioY [Lentilactobacillus buchneri]|uniref:Biotin transporter n=1 Tax=Lentilactobacillus buchneri subsp. silagei CD034 TaxID=1071400 RepID=J9W2K4_LENBU|nr:biotin transporter BioY [Lentilactobacillus buchneri]MCC6101221.1 biotin transporter BioY [Lactobacillus sp.]AFS00733.1 putative biotin transporter bioY [Lentilactobacillus buchneri subsp. silagei CD034]MCT2901991.1 biotin transporter BioY [Lentilactobacillus buchneri]MCT3542536.1 biotin transporter BioY [Lentilactobacillus buchneri]MCT3545321.1 biotin transporter BioY [Lentilactobacillus buchneri]